MQKLEVLDEISIVNLGGYLGREGGMRLLCLTCTWVGLVCCGDIGERGA